MKPIFIGHGRDDDYTRIELMEYCYTNVIKPNDEENLCEFHAYDGFHMFDTPKPTLSLGKLLLSGLKYCFCLNCCSRVSNTKQVQLFEDCCVLGDGEKGFYPLKIKGGTVTVDNELTEWKDWEPYLKKNVKMGEVTLEINEESASKVKEDLLKFLKKIKVT